jgi:hypothetical protein
VHRLLKGGAPDPALFDVIAIQRRVNPREVKRFINSYTLQTLIRPDLKPEAVLALQTLAGFLRSSLFAPLADEPDFDRYTSGLGAAEVPRAVDRTQQ